MKWLQLSDLHIKECADWEMMKKSYTKMISNTKIDFIIVTGDLHNYDEDYSETERFFDEILVAANLEKKDLFIIPGNHDSKDFKHKKAFVNDILGNIEQDSECFKEYENELKYSFQEYVDFYKEYFEIKKYELESVQTYTWNDKINIIGLNSALVSDGNNEHKQIIDILGLTKLNIDNGLPTIAIGHHDISYLFEEHQNVLKRVLTNLNVAAYLCGDLHKNAKTNISNYSTSNKVIPCIVCGKSSIDNTDTYSDNSFIIYQYDENIEDDNVVINLYRWNAEKKNFYESSDFNNDDGEFKFSLYPSGKNINKGRPAVNNKKAVDFDERVKLQGYVLIGPRGNNGIKYIWKKNDMIVESLAFNKRLNSVNLSDIDNNTSTYTASISHGCILNADSSQCIFCDTGNSGFKGYLSSEDIALQNIFMAEYDADCSSYPEVRNNIREFSYMGQGEPGHAYHLIRKSIILTDYAMSVINQKVSRYIISTCGIDGFVPLLLSDIKNGIYKNKISLHFSLNAIDGDRDILMPVNRTNSFRAFIEECESYFEFVREKIAVSIIIFNNLKFDSKNVKFLYSLTEDKLKGILSVLDPRKFRIDLRDFNSNETLQLKGISNEYATRLLDIVTELGFEGKLFSCFGEGEKAACGMLASATDGMSKHGATTTKHYKRALELLNESIKNIRG